MGEAKRRKNFRDKTQRIYEWIMESPARVAVMRQLEAGKKDARSVCAALIEQFTVEETLNAIYEISNAGLANLTSAAPDVLSGATRPPAVSASAVAPDPDLPA